VLACGNSADVDVADGVAALAEDPACAAIACVFEGMADPTRLALLWHFKNMSTFPSYRHAGKNHCCAAA
jgi:hypothetical protein